jgi:hypothetical protein
MAWASASCSVQSLSTCFVLQSSWQRPDLELQLLANMPAAWPIRVLEMLLLLCLTLCVLWAPVSLHCCRVCLCPAACRSAISAAYAVHSWGLHLCPNAS